MEVFLMCLLGYLAVGLLLFCVIRNQEWWSAEDGSGERFINLFCMLIIILLWPGVIYVWVRESVEAGR